MDKYIYKETSVRRACWDCEKEYKNGDTVRIVPSIQITGSTDDICNKCYSKRLLIEHK